MTKPFHVLFLVGTASAFSGRTRGYGSTCSSRGAHTIITLNAIGPNSFDLPSAGDLKSQLPSVDIDAQLRSLDLKSKLPSVEMPSVDLKSIEMPSVDLPSVDLKTLDMSIPSMNIPGIEDSTTIIPVAGIGLLVALVAILASQSGGDETAPATTKKQSKKRNTESLTIPYDAAARLAYDAWLKENNGESYSDNAFEAFKATYESRAIADATAKKLARDLGAFQNKAAAPKPQKEKPKKEMPPAVTKKSPVKKDEEAEAEVNRFFFASEQD